MRKMPKGQIPWNKGKKFKHRGSFTRGHKRGMTGKKHSDETKQKMRNNHAIVFGDKNPNWKGGISNRNPKVRKGSWKKWRRKVLEKDNFICQICKKERGNLCVHHLQRWNEFPDRRFDIHNGITLCAECHHRLHTKPKDNLRKAFVDALLTISETNKDVILLTNDVGFGYFERYRDKYPKQFINIGLAEQNLVGVSTGLALAGKTPFAFSMITFLLFRPYEQIRTCCYHNAPVNFIGTAGSSAYSFLGPSHNIYYDEDIVVLCKLPNLKIHIPLTSKEVYKVVEECVNNKKPNYVRL